MARITVEDCLEVVNNRFELVTMAAKRARQLANGVEAQIDNTEAQDKPTVLALREIAARKIDNELIDRVEKAERERAEREALEWAAAEVVADGDLSEGDDWDQRHLTFPSERTITGKPAKAGFLHFRSPDPRCRGDVTGIVWRHEFRSHRQGTPQPRFFA